MRIKDPATAAYVLEEPDGTITTTVGGGGGGTGRERRSLTDKEREELEEAGKIIVKRALEEMGFSVEKMPRDNPGFDLRAKTDEDELRIEVKAHSGRATVVELTQREYKEYLEREGYRWELWNVEHLMEDDDSYPIRITRYDQIPIEALDVRTFRVDLKRCHRKVKG